MHLYARSIAYEWRPFERFDQDDLDALVAVLSAAARRGPQDQRERVQALAVLASAEVTCRGT